MSSRPKQFTNDNPFRGPEYRYDRRPERQDLQRTIEPLEESVRRHEAAESRARLERRHAAQMQFEEAARIYLERAAADSASSRSIAAVTTMLADILARQEEELAAERAAMEREDALSAAVVSTKTVHK
jgi:hypothetical protein